MPENPPVELIVIALLPCDNPVAPVVIVMPGEAAGVAFIVIPVAHEERRSKTVAAKTHATRRRSDNAFTSQGWSDGEMEC